MVLMQLTILVSNAEVIHERDAHSLNKLHDIPKSQDTTITVHGWDDFCDGCLILGTKR
ncbi:hypothetical protein GGI35DRAFT_457280 [Trichoderma velutinum]